MAKIKILNLELEKDICFQKKILIEGYRYFIIKDNIDLLVEEVKQLKVITVDTTHETVKK